MAIKLNLFTLDTKYGVLTPNCNKGYSIRINELATYYEDGTHSWFPHLAGKVWFTQEMFWELLAFTKDRFPSFNADKAIFQTALQFGMEIGYDKK